MENQTKTKIIVYGLKNDAPVQSGGCGCGPEGCGPQATMGEMYDEMVADLSGKMDNLEFEFIDVMENDLDDESEVVALMKKEFPIPYVQINDKLRFYGGISSQAIYNDITKA
ncbi:MAG: hypothetical protein K9L62_07790 [Vallitaleaceae bacterium]|nr:hypothetical protein [Vallitaleaceae bacterium]